MSRKYLDCRDTPSVSGCTLAMSGEEDELLRAAAAHAVDVHGHDDGDELRAGIREDLREVPVADTEPGAFVQLIEFHTARIDEVRALAEEWSTTMGGDGTARWGITAADRDRPNTYVQIVEFPNYEAAMANSANPMTAKFAERMQALCDGPAHYTNLDVRQTRAY